MIFILLIMLDTLVDSAVVAIPAKGCHPRERLSSPRKDVIPAKGCHPRAGGDPEDVIPAKAGIQE